jgi:uncharacterized membrane protein (DUF106 family)
MFKILVYGFIIYIVYRFIFDFAIPVSKASSQVREKLQEMQRQQEEAARQQQAQAQQRASSSKPSVGEDYIEFEEVKK